MTRSFHVDVRYGRALDPYLIYYIADYYLGNG